MAGYTLQLLVFLGLLCLTFQENVPHGDLPRYAVRPPDLESGYEVYFPDPALRAGDENSGGLIKGLLTGLVPNVTGIVTGTLPKLDDILKSGLNIGGLLKGLVNVKGIWKTFAGLLKGIPFIGWVTNIASSVFDVCKCLRSGIKGIFKNAIGLDCKSNILSK